MFSRALSRQASLGSGATSTDPQAASVLKANSSLHLALWHFWISLDPTTPLLLRLSRNIPWTR